jgi:hypothetical protein
MGSIENEITVNGVVYVPKEVAKNHDGLNTVSYGRIQPVFSQVI